MISREATADSRIASRAAALGAGVSHISEYMMFSLSTQPQPLSISFDDRSWGEKKAANSMFIAIASSSLHRSKR